MSSRLSELQGEYQAAAHAMQSGVAMEHELGSADGSSKHLRVGVNSAMLEHSALVRVLVAKRIVTDEEYAEALVTSFREEVERYEKRLSERLGSKVTLA